MISFFACVEDIAFKDDYYLQLCTATRHSKAAVDFIDYDTVATWKSVVDLRHAELEAATKATAEATREPEAALGAAGADDGAAALARPKNSYCIDAAAAGDTAARREANRMVEASASIIIKPESATGLRNKLLSSTAGRFIGQHGVGRRPPLSFNVLRARRPAGQVRLDHLRMQACVRGQDGPTPAHPHLCSC